MHSDHSNWRTIPLSIVALSSPDSFVDGPFGSNLKTSDYRDEGIRLIQLQNIGEGHWNDENKKYISPSKFGQLSRHAAYPGDIAIAKMAEPVARASLIPPYANAYVVVADCIKLTPNPVEFDARFVVYAINHRHARIQAEQKSTGTTRLRINLTVLKTVNISAPPLAEQRRIADILDTADAAIQQTQALIAKLKLMRAGLLHDLLTRGLDERGELRDPVAHPEQFKETMLGPVPDSWQVSGFAALASSERQYIKTGPFGSALKGEHWTENGTPVITIGSLGEGRLIESELLHVDASTAMFLSSYQVAAGDIVFSRVADVGRSVVIDEQGAGWLMSSNLMRISLDQTRIVPNYAYLNLAYHPHTRGQIRRAVNAGGREVANTAILNQLVFSWPSLREQEQIVAIASAYVDRIQAEEAYRDKLKLLKQGLMDDLLTGRVRAPVEEEVTA